MALSLGKKMAVFVSGVTAVATMAIGAASFHLMTTQFAEVLRGEAKETSTQLSARIRDGLLHAEARARLLARAVVEKPAEQTYIEETLARDADILAITVSKRSDQSPSGWETALRLSRPAIDPLSIKKSDFEQLELKYPLELDLVTESSAEVTHGMLRDGTPTLRVAVSLQHKAGAATTDVISIELRQDAIVSTSVNATSLHFSALFDRQNRVIYQSEAKHFVHGEELSGLPILRLAQSNQAKHGTLDYPELPGKPLQYGSFQKIGYGGLVLVTQVPRTLLTDKMRSFAIQLGIILFACSALAATFAWLLSWSLLGSRLKRLINALDRVEDGKYNVNFPDRKATDEIGDFSRDLQRIFAGLDRREEGHASFAKLKSRKLKSRLQKGEINLKGERMNALVVHAHLHGIDQIAKEGDPELFMSLLNKYNQSVSDAIESRQGIVDHIHGGSVIAYWGVPLADSSKDAESAIAACLKIRGAAESFNSALKKNKRPLVQLGMGMHYGSVIAGQVGVRGRYEYTAVGEAVEVASRIHAFADQFKTDLLITSQAAEQAPEWCETEKVVDADDGNPELHEIVTAVAPESDLGDQDDLPPAENDADAA